MRNYASILNLKKKLRFLWESNNTKDRNREKGAMR